MIREAQDMLNRQQLWAGVVGRVFIGSCLALLLIISLMFFPAHVLARTTSPTRMPTSGLTLQVNAGFNARYRDGNWVPLRIALSNTGADFSGTIEVNAPLPFAGQGNDTPLASYKQPITLANGAQKQ